MQLLSLVGRTHKNVEWNVWTPDFSLFQRHFIHLQAAARCMCG